MRRETSQLISVVALSLLAGCQTVANVAQGVADSARGSGKTTAEAPPQQQAAPATPATASTAIAPAAQSACAVSFAVTGSFFTEKQFKAAATVSDAAPDVVYRKAYAEVVRRGYQIIQADKEVRIISASKGVAFSRGGKTVPINVQVEGEKSKKGSIVSFTLTLPGGLATSEDGVRDEFCSIAKAIGEK